MSVGAFFDKIIFIAIGVYLIYFSKKKKEKLGEKKAKWMIICGVGIIVFGIVTALMK